MATTRTYAALEVFATAADGNHDGVEALEELRFDWGHSDQPAVGKDHGFDHDALVLARSNLPDQLGLSAAKPIRSQDLNDASSSDDDDSSDEESEDEKPVQKKPAEKRKREEEDEKPFAKRSAGAGGVSTPVASNGEGMHACALERRRRRYWHVLIRPTICLQ